MHPIINFSAVSLNQANNSFGFFDRFGAFFGKFSYFGCNYAKPSPRLTYSSRFNSSI
jgi:hypothetical protein